jgi:hypothetical protein
MITKLCSNCGKQHSVAKLRTGTKKTLVCSCGSPVTFSEDRHYANMPSAPPARVDHHPSTERTATQGTTAPVRIPGELTQQKQNSTATAVAQSSEPFNATAGSSEEAAAARKSSVSTARVLCLVRLHHWKDCTCTRCGEHRDNNHRWDGCKCAECGQFRDEGHRFLRCYCQICKMESHEWDGCFCPTCGMKRNRFHTWRSFTCTKCGARGTELFEKAVSEYQSGLLRRSDISSITGESPETVWAELESVLSQKYDVEKAYFPEIVSAFLKTKVSSPATITQEGLGLMRALYKSRVGSMRTTLDRGYAAGIEQDCMRDVIKLLTIRYHIDDEKAKHSMTMNLISAARPDIDGLLESQFPRNFMRF